MQRSKKNTVNILGFDFAPVNDRNMTRIKISRAILWNLWRMQDYENGILTVRL